MTLIAGASQYLVSAQLANTQGRPAVASSLLSDNATSLLDVGKQLNVSGIGLSSNARALNKQFLEETSGLFNTLLSAPAEANSVEGLQTQILALRAQQPESAVSPFVNAPEGEGEAGDEGAAEDGESQGPQFTPNTSAARGSALNALV